MKPVLIRQHLESAPPARLVGWLEARGLPYAVDRAWLGAAAPAPAGHAFVVSLGHSKSAGDTTTPRSRPSTRWCGAPSTTGFRCSASATAGRCSRPCSAAGWRARRRRSSGGWPRSRPTIPPWCRPARGWRGTTTPGRCRRVRRRSRARPPRRRRSGSGRTSACSSTRRRRVAVVEGWARADGEHLRELGIEDAGPLLHAPEGRSEAADAASWRLFDAFLAGVAAPA